MRYLVDTSALVRIIRRQVDPVWYDTVDRGLVAICDPVLVETLTIADAKSYSRVEEELRAAYPCVPVPDDVWAVVTYAYPWRCDLASSGAPWPVMGRSSFPAVGAGSDEGAADRADDGSGRADHEGDAAGHSRRAVSDDVQHAASDDQDR
ncbi:hypothetical protein O7635_21280 [Asanoa sp. WMMD1127]|uniref:hypothetical protein n=1 Tax=Asanoa sp. WMMD1127 TaxID=3016107 RepID=UPI00241693EF|nr:hypothetical protein [Asanoa sp. WMMD1127]MDG4824392.1 hypothetical protein [Asanoa sp. WMMD1127]